jgi:hypothetical protein
MKGSGWLIPEHSDQADVINPKKWANFCLLAETTFPYCVRKINTRQSGNHFQLSLVKIRISYADRYCIPLNSISYSRFFFFLVVSHYIAQARL